MYFISYSYRLLSLPSDSVTGSTGVNVFNDILHWSSINMNFPHCINQVICKFCFVKPDVQWDIPIDFAGTFLWMVDFKIQSLKVIVSRSIPKLDCG